MKEPLKMKKFLIGLLMPYEELPAPRRLEKIAEGRAMKPGCFRIITRSRSCRGLQVPLLLSLFLLRFSSASGASEKDHSGTTSVISPAETHGRICLGPLTRLYADSEMPYTMDGSWATLKNADGSMTFYETAMAKAPYYFRHAGPPGNPLQKQLAPFKWDYNGFNHAWPSGCWLTNIHRVSADTLIGFVHRENLHPGDSHPHPQDRYYIGLARSFDGGTTWKYLGDVIGTGGNSNIGGVPCLAVGGYFNIYYNEKDPANAPIGLCVARAKIADVIGAIRKGTVCPFAKYSNGGWSENALTGKGSSVIPDIEPSYDFHSDATYCRPLGKYLITVQTHGLGKLYLYQSTDGVSWGDRITLDSAPDNMHPYSSIVGFDPGSSADSFAVGSEFYIYINRKKMNNYDEDEMCCRKVVITKPKAVK